jgi:hypothetical protein
MSGLTRVRSCRNGSCTASSWSMKVDKADKMRDRWP